MILGLELAPAVKKRQAIERKIVRSFAKEMIAAGFTIRIDNGGDSYETPHLNRIGLISKAIMATDEERLYVFRKEADGTNAKKPFAWAFFVYGNDGWDVMSDYTTNLDGLMPLTQAMIDKEGAK